MLESLKKKTLLGNLWCIIVLGIVTAALGVVFGSGIVKMLAGPAYFDPLDDHEDILSLQGQYITMDVDTLIDYYAETVRSESGKRDEVSAREYIMPINTPDATIYIGLEVPASKIDDAEAVVDDTARMLDDEDGNYEWDGSYVTVRGTLKRMDDETKQLWEDYFIDAGFSYDDIGLEDGCTFLPLVLTDDEIDGSDTFVLGFMGIVILLVLALLIWFVVRSLTGGFQKQIRNYIKASDDPQATEQALDRFYEDTMQDGRVRMSRSWLMYDKGGNSWVLAGDDVVWAYQYTVRHKAYGILTVRKELMVRVFGAKEKRACHDIYVRNEDEAQEILQQMARTYPDALIGYDQDIERKYRANPAAFHQAVITARHAPAAPAAEPTEPAQEPESKPLYTESKNCPMALDAIGQFFGQNLLLRFFFGFLRKRNHLAVRFLAQVVLDLAGVLGGSLRVNAQRDEERRQLAVAAIDALGNFHARRFQLNKTVGIHRNIAVLTQVFHGDTDARLGKAHRHRNIDRAHRTLLFLQHQNFFEIILCGFVNIHGRSPLPN